VVRMTWKPHSASRRPGLQWGIFADSIAASYSHRLAACRHLVYAYCVLEARQRSSAHAHSGLGLRLSSSKADVRRVALSAILPFERPENRRVAAVAGGETSWCHRPTKAAHHSRKQTLAGPHEGPPKRGALWPLIGDDKAGYLTFRAASSFAEPYRCRDSPTASRSSARACGNRESAAR